MPRSHYSLYTKNRTRWKRFEWRTVKIWTVKLYLHQVWSQSYQTFCFFFAKTDKTLSFSKCIGLNDTCLPGPYANSLTWHVACPPRKSIPLDIPPPQSHFSSKVDMISQDVHVFSTRSLNVFWCLQNQYNGRLGLVFLLGAVLRRPFSCTLFLYIVVQAPFLSLWL